MTDENCDTCDASSCSAKNRRPDEALEAFLERQALAKRMCGIEHKILVFSGKGGVGKSTVAANLAAALAADGKRVGLLDVDFHGPSIPRLLGLDGVRAGGAKGDGGIAPLRTPDGLRVMSIAALLEGRDSAVIWRGPLKMNVIKQLLRDVDWGELDYLIIDSPPGTGDEPLSVAQLIEGADGAVLVTTPQALSSDDVRRAVTFCRQVNLPVLGIIENMSGFVCPHCGKETQLFKAGGGEALAAETGVPFLGSVPIDPQVVTASDEGRPFVLEHPDSAAGRAFTAAIEPIRKMAAATMPAVPQDETGVRRIAVPLAEGRMSLHFGHCQEFALVDVDETRGEIGKVEHAPAPDHQPGLLPRWLAERGANIIIASGMGARAQGLFEQAGIKVIVGAPREEPEAVVRAYLDGTLPTGDNVCDH
jgi:Mrp family chromosome partitioning ATPase/predicted Fe-Mo cluster-binding NifX family protein